MGRASTAITETEQACALRVGTFTGTGTSEPLLLRGDFNLLLSGTFVATVLLERSFDGGATWQQMNLQNGGAGISFTAPINTVIETGPEIGVLYRLNCSAFTSGTVGYRLSQ